MLSLTHSLSENGSYLSGIGDRGACALAEALKANSTLTTLG